MDESHKKQKAGTQGINNKKSIIKLKKGGCNQKYLRKLHCHFLLRIGSMRKINESHESGKDGAQGIKRTRAS